MAILKITPEQREQLLTRGQAIEGIALLITLQGGREQVVAITEEDQLVSDNATVIFLREVFDSEEKEKLFWEGSAKLQELRDVPLSELKLPNRVFNKLDRTGIKTIGQVIDLMRRDNAILAVRNFGDHYTSELIDRLVREGVPPYAFSSFHLRDLVRHFNDQVLLNAGFRKIDIEDARR